MKQLKFLRTWLLLLCLALSTGVMWGETVNFTLGSGKDISSNSGATKSGITITATDGTSNANNWGGASYVRLQAGGTFVITPSSATITSIVLNCTSGYEKTWSASIGNAPVVNTTNHTVTWTGSTTSAITLTNTASAQARVSSIDVTYTTSGGTNPEPTKYTVIIANNIANGTVTASPTSAAEGDEVTLTATPASGYEFGEWNVTDASSNAITVTDNKFTMPASDVNVSATFNEIQTGGEPSGDYVFYESFDRNDGTGGNDDKWSGNIATSTIYYDNDGWELTGVNGANKCIKVGAGSRLGFATTPSISASGNFILTFKAGAWDGSSESTKLKLSAVNATLGVSSVTMKKGEWTEYTVNVTNATTGFTIKFEGNATSNSRFFLDEVKIVKAGPAEIPNLIKTESANLYVGDEIENLKTYLNLPNDYTGDVTFSTVSEAVEIDGSYILATAAGTASIYVTAGAVDGKYLETTGSITLNISKKTPVLTWDDNKTSYTLFNLADNDENKFIGQSATATEGATVKYSISGTGATIDADGIVEIIGEGTAIITASTMETDALNAATSISYTLNIVQPTITMSPEDGIISAANSTITFTGNGTAIDYVCLDPELMAESTGTTISVDLTQSCTIATTITDDAENKFTEAYDIIYLQDAGLRFSAETQAVSMDAEPFAALELTKSTDATELKYSLDIKGDDTNPIATIDEETGIITLSGTKATNDSRTIYVVATTPATENYAAGEARYQLIVNKLKPALAWSATEATVDLNEEDKLPTLSNPKELKVTYASSNEEVADFNEGVLELKNAGKTIISASISSSDYYDATTVSYELTFAPRYTVTFSINGEETVLREETSGAGVTAPEVGTMFGKAFLGWIEEEIEGTTNDAPTFVTNAGSTLDGNKTFYAVFATATGSGEGSVVFDVNSITDIQLSIAQRTQVADGIIFTFSSVGATGTNNNTVQMSKGSTLTQDKPFVGSIKSIEFEEFSYSGTSKASMLIEGKKGVDGTYATVQSCGSSYTGALIDFSSNEYDMFKITVGSERTVKFTKMTVNYSGVTYSGYCTTVPNTATITLNPACHTGVDEQDAEYNVYGTFSCSSAFIVPETITVEEVGVSADGKLNVKAYEVGNIVPANTGVMVHANAGGDYTIVLSNNEGTSVLGEENRLRPSGDDGIKADAMLADDADCKFYRLTMHKGVQIGFFWGAEGGTAFDVAANKAYLAVPNSLGTKFNSIWVESETNGIDCIDVNIDGNETYYNIAGQRVNASHKGIVIVNGRKYINK